MNDPSGTGVPGTGPKRDWPLILGIVTVGVTVIGLLPAYFIFWHRSDVVFDKRAVEIPLSAPLRKTIEGALANAGRTADRVAVAKNGVEVPAAPSQLPSAKLPDRLLYVNVRNLGKIPSSLIKVQIRVPGIIADKDVSGAGPVLGDISAQRNSGDGIYFECPNLANEGAARLKVAIWYQQTDSYSPSVEVLETAEGPAREVGSVDTAGFYIFDVPSHHWWVVLLVSLPIWLLLNWLIEYLLRGDLVRRLLRLLSDRL